jgi:MFS family permease
MNSERKIFHGWWIVAASIVGLFWGVPIAVYSFSVFFKPLMQEFHAGRAAISFGFTLQLLAGAASAPFAGWQIDRFGPRKVALVGTTIFASILLINRIFSGSLWQFYLFYALLGLALQSVGPIPYGDVICRWFDRRRGLALGLMMLGIGAGAIVVPSLAQRLIARFGWHAAYLILGAAFMASSLPVLAAFLKDNPEDLGLLPDGEARATSAGGSDAAHQGVSASEAFRSGEFWLMVSAFVLVSASVQGCVIHMAAMLSDRGINAQTAALGSSLVGAAVLIGRVGTGYLLDRIFAPRLAAVLFAGAAVGVALLWMGTARLAFAGAFLVGLGLGAELDIIAFLTGRYFGLRAFGKIYSIAIAAFAAAGALGPLIMGAGFDRTGSYRGTLAGFLGATLVAAALMTRLGPYRYHAPRRDSEAPAMPVRVEDQPCKA